MYLTRKGMIRALELIRDATCAYTNTNFCDCKFGVTREKARHLTENGNGCPELREAIHVIERMTDLEYKIISKRKRPWVEKERIEDTSLD